MKIALLQKAARKSASENLKSHIADIKKAAKSGAKIICTQELFLGEYFCISENSENFKLAHALPNEHTRALCKLCKDLQIVLIASFFEDRDCAGRVYHNTSIVIDADGKMLGKYRKMHIPQDPCFEEKFYFTPGDLGYKVWDTTHGKVGVLICWDQWYPEAARLTALEGADIIFYPTAIGTLPTEKSAELEKFKNAWHSVQKGHAVANGVFIAAANRIGVETSKFEKEKSIRFWGSSFVANPYGQMIALASEDKEEILYANVDFDEAKEFRQTWPFFRDRRIDSYSKISQRFGE